MAKNKSKKKVIRNKPLTVRQLEQKYNLLTKEVKEKFKERTGKQIARGFQDSPEFKAVEKSRKRAIARKVKPLSKKAFEVISDRTEEESRKLNPTEREEIEKALGLKKGSINYLVYRQIFYLVLSYGDGKFSKLVQNEVSDLFKQGFSVTFVADFPSGQERATTDFTTFLQYMEKFYNQCIELQEKATAEAGSTVYPFVDVISFKLSEKVSTITLQLSPDQGLDQFLPL